MLDTGGGACPRAVLLREDARAGRDIQATNPYNGPGTLSSRALQALLETHCK